MLYINDYFIIGLLCRWALMSSRVAKQSYVLSVAAPLDALREQMSLNVARKRLEHHRIRIRKGILPIRLRCFERSP